MHRLKKWFGIEDKDPDVPLTFSRKKSPDTQLQSVTSDSKVPLVLENSSVNNAASTVSVDEVPVTEKRKTLSSVIRDKKMLPDVMDIWLRRYVPLAPNECLECKLVSLATLGLFTGILTVSLRNEARRSRGIPRIHFCLRIATLAGFGFGMRLLYERWYNLRTFEPRPEHFTDAEWKEHKKLALKTDYEDFVKAADKYSEKLKAIMSDKS